MSSDDDLKKPQNPFRAGSGAGCPVPLFCLLRQRIRNMGGLGIFAYILGTDNDMCRITRPESFVMCTAGMLVPTEKPGSEAHLFPAPPSPFESYYPLLTRAAPASLTISDRITAVGSTAAGRTWWPPPQLLLPVPAKCRACQPHPLPGAIFVNQFHFGPLSRR